MDENNNNTTSKALTLIAVNQSRNSKPKGQKKGLKAEKNADLDREFEMKIQRFEELKKLNPNLSISTEELEDPISFELMKDAVTTSCGHTFSQASLAKWFKYKRSGDLPLSCPLCNQTLNARKLTPNINVRLKVAQLVNDEQLLVLLKKSLPEGTIQDLDLNNNNNLTVYPSFQMGSKTVYYYLEPFLKYFPQSVVTLILSYLEPEDLLQLPQLNSMWLKYCSLSVEMNEAWWKLCMEYWHFKESGLPRFMTARDRKQNWKKKFLTLGRFTEVLPSRRAASVKKQSFIIEPPSEQELKKEMRLYYKSKHAKDKKGKKWHVDKKEQVENSILFSEDFDESSATGESEEVEAKQEESQQASGEETKKKRKDKLPKVLEQEDDWNLIRVGAARTPSCSQPPPNFLHANPFELIEEVSS